MDKDLLNLLASRVDYAYLISNSTLTEFGERLLKMVHRPGCKTWTFPAYHMQHGIGDNHVHGAWSEDEKSCRSIWNRCATYEFLFSIGLSMWEFKQLPARKDLRLWHFINLEDYLNRTLGKFSAVNYLLDRSPTHRTSDNFNYHFLHSMERTLEIAHSRVWDILHLVMEHGKHACGFSVLEDRDFQGGIK